MSLETKDRIISQDGTKILINPSFELRLKEISKKDYDLFLRYSTSFLRRSIRVNTIKITTEELKSRLEKDFVLEQIPWCQEGFWITHKNERRDIGNLIEHQLGYIYIQEAASMLPPLVLQPTEHDLVLDMAASPGSKTTQIAALMNNKGLLIANDYKGSRLVMLGLNIQRCGLTNTIITLNDSRKQNKNLSNKFDKILLDAPCSASGALRKSLKTFETWNPKLVKSLSKTQKTMIINAFQMLKPKGTLVYSTCSIDPEENEEVVSYLLENQESAKLEEIELKNKIKHQNPILEFNNKKYNKELKKALRIFPQDNDTEGFFVAKIIKRE